MKFAAKVQKLCQICKKKVKKVFHRWRVARYSLVGLSLYNRDRPTKEWASTAKNAVFSLSPSLPLRYHYVTFDYGASIITILDFFIILQQSCGIIAMCQFFHMKTRFFIKKCARACIYQKKAVILQAFCANCKSLNCKLSNC